MWSQEIHKQGNQGMSLERLCAVLQGGTDEVLYVENNRVHSVSLSQWHDMWKDCAMEVDGPHHHHPLWILFNEDREVYVYREDAVKIVTDK